MGEHFYDKASLLSCLFICWAKPYIDDVELPTDPPKNIRIQHFSDLLAKNWKEESSKQNPSFSKVFYKTFTPIAFLKLWGFFVQAITLIIYVVIMGYLIQEIQNRGQFYIAFIYGFTASLLLIFNFIGRQIGFLQVFLQSGVLKHAILKLLYEKLLRLSHNEIYSKDTSSKLINLVSVDIELLDFAGVILYMAVSILATLAISGILYFYMGWSGLVGIGIVIGVAFLQQCMGKFYTSLRIKIGNCADDRIGKTKELVQGIKILKMYGWEQAYGRQIEETRKREVTGNRWRIMIRAFNESFFMVTQGLASLGTFGTYLLWNEQISGLQIFITLSLLVSAQLFLASILSYSFELFWTYFGSFERIKEFLMLSQTQKVKDKYRRGGIKLIDCSASYKTQETKSFGLQKINAKVKPGELCFIVGRVGSGKTTFLRIILQEIDILEGKILTEGKIAYIEQEPWIISSTILENILLGRRFDKEKLDQVIYASALTQDINDMPNGLQTLLGQRGITLSGGQKARISIARALYSEADIYLFDDPLSAVDATVGGHIMNECVLKFLQEKTRVIVTHQTHYIPKRCKVYQIQQGSILETKSKHFEIVNQEEQVQKPVDQGVGAGEEQGDQQEIPVSFSMIFVFLNYGWKLAFPALFILFPLTMILYMFIPYWLAVWSSQDEEDQSNDIYINLLLLVVLSLFFFTLIKNILLGQTSQTACNSLFSQGLAKLVRFQPKFFDQNSTGMIMGRLSNDIGQMDELLTWTIMEALQLLFLTMGALLTMLISNPVMIVLILPLLFALYKIYKKAYVSSRIHYTHYNASKSPLISQISATFSGLISLRALGIHQGFKTHFSQLLNYYTGKHLTFRFTAEWQDFYSNFAGCVFCVFNIFLAISLMNVLEPTLLVTGLSMIIVLSINLVWASFKMSELKTLLVSPHRLRTFFENTLQAQLETQNNLNIKTPRIVYKEVYLQYVEGTFALDNLSFVIEAGENVGIVGRTGSGKSSIIQSLFRLYQISNGKILIDNIDISKVGLHTLRKQISVIPQSPFLFSASLRYNIDPFSQHSDDQLRVALKLSHLNQKVQSFDNKLDQELTPNSLSVGQKQLLCLARALLKKNKILVMDEATANVDLYTDRKIHKAVKKNFKESTVIVIAHRLETIIESDKIILMKRGKCVEYGTPKELLSSKKTRFYKLVQSTGEADELIGKIVHK